MKKTQQLNCFIENSQFLIDGEQAKAEQLIQLDMQGVLQQQQQQQQQQQLDAYKEYYRQLDLSDLLSGRSL